jgi:hypothetical protein
MEGQGSRGIRQGAVPLSESPYVRSRNALVSQSGGIATRNAAPLYGVHCMDGGACPP